MDVVEKIKAEILRLKESYEIYSARITKKDVLTDLDNLLLFIDTIDDGCISENDGTFVDLGLPSGKKWAHKNECGYHSFEDAKKYKDALPSVEDWKELVIECLWTWDDKRRGYSIKGKNGNRIFLPALGYKEFSRVSFEGINGFYLSSSCSMKTYNWYMFFTQFTNGVMDNCKPIYELSVRLIKK